MNLDFGYELKVKNNYVTLVNKQTGEIIKDREQVEKILEMEQLNAFHKFTSMKRKIGIDEDRTILNKKNQKIKRKEEKNKIPLPNKDFVKVYKYGDVDMLSFQELTIDEAGFLMKLVPYLDWETNRVLIDNRIPKKLELCEILGVGKKKFLKILKGLIEKEYISIKTNNNDKFIDIYFSPNYFCMGESMLDKTMNMFYSKK